MKSFTFISLFIFHFLQFSSCFSQREKIENLQKALPSLKDSARIDCLNAISEAYIGLPDWFSEPATKAQYDSAQLFAGEALEEAKKIAYTYGMVKAYSLNSEISFDIYNNYPHAEKFSR